jgi:hypothetical protein
MFHSAGGYWRLKGLFFSDNWIWLFSGYGFGFFQNRIFQLDMDGSFKRIRSAFYRIIGFKKRTIFKNTGLKKKVD